MPLKLGSDRQNITVCTSCADHLACMEGAHENSTIAVSGRREHMLWWKPGAHGKGILYRSGIVHTWPEEEVHHHAMSDLHIARTGDEVRLLFLVHPDGKVHLFATDAAEADQLAGALSSADRRLQLVAAEPSPQPSLAERSAGPVESKHAEWLMWQHRGAAVD
jgi:hypothetical protein